MLRTTDGTAALLALEDSKQDFLFEVLPGTADAIWPFLRMSFAGAMAEVELNSVVVARGRTRAQQLRRLARAYFPDHRSARSIRRKRDLLFFAAGGTTRVTADGNENWLVDGFAREFSDQSVIVQDRPFGSASPAFSATYSFDSSLARADVATRLAKSSEAQSRAIESVANAAAAALDFEFSPKTVAIIASKAAYRLSRLPHVNREYSRLLDRVQPKVAILDGASYLNRGTLGGILRDRGILVVEPQHGWIGPSHAAYNFGKAMFSPELRRNLPDVLLTFGDFWSESIRHPAEVISIGKPHMDAMAQAARPLTERPQDVLVVSSVSNPEEAERFTLQLRKRLPEGWTIRFRPHPSERPTLGERYPGLVAAEGIEIDVFTDVYESLAEARVVVGVASTVLYEALALGCKVFVRDSAMAEYYVGDLFGEVLDEARLVESIAATLSDTALPSLTSATMDSIWMPNSLTTFGSLARTWLLDSPSSEG